MDNQYPPGYLSYGQQFKTEPGQQQQPASQQSQQGQQFKSEQPQQQSQQSQHPPQQQPGLSSFGSLSATPGHSQQDSPASGHPTLPPLQNQNGGYAQFGSMSYAHPGSQSHTPTTPHTPVTSSLRYVIVLDDVPFLHLDLHASKLLCWWLTYNQANASWRRRWTNGQPPESRQPSLGSTSVFHAKRGGSYTRGWFAGPSWYSS
jgi:hypothetical protein